MAEQNNQAERAAAEFDAEEAGIEILRFLQQRKAPQAMIDKLITMSCAAGGYETIRRRAALPATVDAEGLPTPYATVIDHDNAGGNSTIDAWMELYEPVYTVEQVRQIIAADRRKQSTLQALYDAGQDIEASGERKLSKAQIDDIVYRCRQGGNDTTYDIVNAAIAYIDGRTAGAAVPPGWKLVPVLPTLEMQQEALKAARACKLEDGQPRPLPNGYELWSATFVYRKMIDAAPSHQSPGKER